MTARDLWLCLLSRNIITISSSSTRINHHNNHLVHHSVSDLLATFSVGQHQLLCLQKSPRTRSQDIPFKLREYKATLVGISSYSEKLRAWHITVCLITMDEITGIHGNGKLAKIRVRVGRKDIKAIICSFISLSTACRLVFLAVDEIVNSRHIYTDKNILTQS